MQRLQQCLWLFNGYELLDGIASQTNNFGIARTNMYMPIDLLSCMKLVMAQNPGTLVFKQKYLQHAGIYGCSSKPNTAFPRSVVQLVELFSYPSDTTIHHCFSLSLSLSWDLSFLSAAEPAKKQLTGWYSMCLIPGVAFL